MKLSSLFIAVGAMALPSFAETPANTLSDSQKLDTLLVGQKKIMQGQETIIQAVADEPLAGKNFGIEINPFRILTWGVGNSASASGTVSLFNVSRSAELAFPIFYRHFSQDREDLFLPKNDFTVFSADAHFRKFLGRRQNGFYLSGFGRLSHLSGYKAGEEMANVFGISLRPSTEERLTRTKFGAGAGLGYRIFSHRGMYWGCGLSLGRYFNGGENEFVGTTMMMDEDSPYIIDVEVFKFGWAF